MCGPMPAVASHFFVASILLIQRADHATASTWAVSLIRDWVKGGLFVQPLRGTRPSQYHHSSHPGVNGQFGRKWELSAQAWASLVFFLHIVCIFWCVSVRICVPIWYSVSA